MPSNEDAAVPPPSEWRARTRVYTAEAAAFAVPIEEVFAHPLLGQNELERAKVLEVAVQARAAGDEQALAEAAQRAKALKAKERAVVIDPLGASDPLGAGDPLSDPLSYPLSNSFSETLASVIEKSITNSSSSNPAIAGANRLDVDENFEPWSSKTSAILQKYTTNEKFSITCSYLPDQQGMAVAVTKSAVNPADQVKERLEELEEEENPVHMDDLSQSDYIKRIEQLTQELTKSWEGGQRVKTLKIAIQAAKLLADMSVIKFFPSKWVLLTNILDSFGKLVFDRIKSKAMIEKPGQRPVPLPENFTADMVPESAKEPCRNWFYKIASIRELIPRLYVEMALLKCYSFLEVNDYSDALKRLTKMLRGIGDPLAQIYARAYLCRVGWNVAPGVRDHVMDNVEDFFLQFNQIRSKPVDAVRSAAKMDLFSYTDLLTPAVEWILQCAAYKAPETTMKRILKLYEDHCKASNVLNCILTAFEPSYIARHAGSFSTLINEAEALGCQKHQLQRTLGVNLVFTEPPVDQRRGIFDECWKVATEITDPAEYMSCAEVWIEYPVKYFGAEDVNAFLADIISHVSNDRAFERLYGQLTSTIQKLLIHIHDFSVLFNMPKFMPFIDLFQKDSVRVEVCKMIMNKFCEHSRDTTSDPVIVNSLMFVGRQLHDSINALSFEDERRQVSQLIAFFIRKIDFGLDFEAQLNFYVEARAAFTNLDFVLCMCVHSVNGLIMRARSMVKGQHSRKTAAFVRGCGAYNFITIPSIVEVIPRLKLYLLCGQVLVVNQALTQADSFFKAAVTTLSELPAYIEIDGKSQSSEKYLVDFVFQFFSTLLYVPDHPEQTQLYILRGLHTAILKYEWDSKGDSKARLLLDLISLACALGQETFLYHIDDVESNDTLYAQSKAYMNIVHELIAAGINDVVEHMHALGEATDNASSRRLADLAIELLERILGTTDLTVKRTAVLSVRLWNLAKNNPSVDNKRLKRLVDYGKLLTSEHKGEYAQALSVITSKFV